MHVAPLYDVLFESTLLDLLIAVIEGQEVRLLPSYRISMVRFITCRYRWTRDDLPID